MSRIQIINTILYKYDPCGLEGAPPDEYMSEAEMIDELPKDLTYNQLFSGVVKIFTRMFGDRRMYRLSKLRSATKELYEQ